MTVGRGAAARGRVGRLGCRARPTSRRPDPAVHGASATQVASRWASFNLLSPPFKGAGREPPPLEAVDDAAPF